MARARNIKPGFFRNEELAELTPLTRLLFAGLWTIADREGRLEDRPKRIKADLLPYDDGDIEEMLEALATRHFIARYSHGAARYIHIINFGKHQNPHKNEAPSEIPALGVVPALDGVSGPTLPTDILETPENIGNRKGSSTSTIQVPEQHQSYRADSLNSDSLNSDSGGSPLTPLGADAPPTGSDPGPPADDEQPKQRRKKPSTPLPKDFALTPERLAYAVEAGLQEFDARNEFRRFGMQAEATDRRQVDWDASWKQWVLGEVPKYRSRHARDSARASPASSREDAERRLQEMRARRAQETVP